MLITSGGWLVLVALLMLIWHLFSVSAPLLGAPSLKQVNSWQLSGTGNALAVGKNAFGYYLYWQNEECTSSLVQLSQEQKSISSQRVLRSACAEKSQIISLQNELYIADIASEGRLRVFHLSITPERSPKKQLSFSVRLPNDIELTRYQKWQVQMTRELVLFTVETPDKRSELLAFSRTTRELEHRQIIENGLLSATADSGNTLAWLPSGILKFGAQGNTFYVKEFLNKPKRIIQSPGAKSFYLLYDKRIEKFTFANQLGQLSILTQFSLSMDTSINDFELAPNGQTSLIFSNNSVHWLNNTTGELMSKEALVQGSFYRYLDERHLLIAHNDKLTKWEIINPSASITASSLWDELWYDGYQQSGYVWQTSSASDYQQPKYSVVPLVLGSIKASFLAILVALPLGFGSAVYCGFFVPFRVRKYLKPAVELIEAVPSVVIGFVAAIWLLPIAEKYLAGVFLFILFSPIALLVFGVIANKWGVRLKNGWELIFAVVCIASFLTFFELAWSSDSHGTHMSLLHQWLDSVFELHANKNTLVLALALGFAIVPTVFSIAEDAIHEVPKSIQLASFAMGATRVQTLQRIVLVAAMPGLISAAMLGFARAFGETMIVILVSGNTPIASWDLLDGVRTLTANLAIELPEAQVDSAHYRILFFTALILFGFTFVLNTIAELLRIRSRRNFGSLK